MRKPRHFFVVLLSLAVLLSCNLPSAGGPKPADPTAMMTFAAQTVDALMTQTGQARTSQPGLVTATPGLLTATMTARTTATNTPPPPTNTPIPCDRAGFVADVTVDDGTEFNPGDSITKKWELQNTGSCTWNTSYSAVFDSGDKMGAPSSVSLPNNVAPGQKVVVTVSMTAPSSPGEYRGNWKLRNASGGIFGLGNANAPFYIVIKVREPTRTPTVPGTSVKYNFAGNYCDAQWVSGPPGGSLLCPGGAGDSEGFVLRVDNPTLQDGTVYSGQSIETHPKWIDDGVISGRFPAFDVKSGQRLRAVIGCLQGGNNCDYEYQITYRADGGSLTLLYEGTMAYGQPTQNLNIDLGSLAGKSVEFSLVVKAKGSSSQDWAVWVNPRIVQ